MTFIFVGIAILISFIASLVLVENLIFYGLGLILLQSTLGFLATLVFGGEPATMFSIFIGAYGLAWFFRRFWLGGEA